MNEEEKGTEVPGVYAKINEVMGQVGRIAKTGRNDFHNYDYVEESEIVETIRPLMSDAGLVCIPSQGERQEVVVETKGGETTIVKILHTFRFVDSEDGSQVEITVWGEGQDKMDKGSYKAFTGAQKYALLKTFQISTGDDPERDASHNGRRSKPARKASGKQKSQGATDKQLGFIRGLMKDKAIPEEHLERLKARLDQGMSKEQASKAIEWLQDRPDAEEDSGKGESTSSASSPESESGDSEASEAPPTPEASDARDKAKAQESWITLWDDHRDPRTSKRREFEAKVLDDPELLGDDDLPDHSKLEVAHYERLADALMDEESQTEMEVGA